MSSIVNKVKEAEQKISNKIKGNDRTDYDNSNVTSSNLYGAGTTTGTGTGGTYQDPTHTRDSAKHEASRRDSGNPHEHSIGTAVAGTTGTTGTTGHHLHKDHHLGGTTGATTTGAGTTTGQHGILGGNKHHHQHRDQPPTAEALTGAAMLGNTDRDTAKLVGRNENPYTTPGSLPSERTPGVVGSGDNELAGKFGSSNTGATSGLPQQQRQHNLRSGSNNNNNNLGDRQQQQSQGFDSNTASSLRTDKYGHESGIGGQSDTLRGTGYNAGTGMPLSSSQAHESLVDSGSGTYGSGLGGSGAGDLGTGRTGLSGQQDTTSYGVTGAHGNENVYGGRSGAGHPTTTTSTTGGGLGDERLGEQTGRNAY